MVLGDTAPTAALVWTRRPAMRRSKAFDCIIAALIGVIVTGASIYIIWAAAFVMNAIEKILG